MATLFIADLHLSPDTPELNQAFRAFCLGPAAKAEALYILGDLFEAWAGDDLAGAFEKDVAAHLAGLASRGVPVFLMGGNRDFLMGSAFATQARCSLLGEHETLLLDGQATLLIHGDTLCTDDAPYQAFRQMVRAPAWQADFLAAPAEQRLAQVKAYRRQSETDKQAKAASIMDVNEAAVCELLRQHGYPRLIHGHTHRPARHDLNVDGHPCERWVLPDWRDQAVWLEHTAGTCHFRQFSSDGTLGGQF